MAHVGNFGLAGWIMDKDEHETEHESRHAKLGARPLR